MVKHRVICPYCNKIVDKNNHDCPVLKKIKNKKAKEYQKNEEWSAKELTSQKWRNYRKMIILRDGGICQRCKYLLGINNSDNLEIHHIKPRIKYPELMYDDNNVITLCKQCNDHLGLNGLDFDWKPQQADWLDPKL